MIWRRVLVPETYTLRELHGVFQVAMGWEGIHLFEFNIRAVGYTSFELSGESPDVALAQFRFRKNAKFIYRYDMGCDWVHEVRVEQRTPVEPKRRYPVCTGGSGACPPEDCGGVSHYLDRRDDALGFEALEDIADIADFVDQVVLQERYELLKDEQQRWKMDDILARCRAREPYLDDHFSRRTVNNAFRQREHQRLMHQHV